MATATIGRPGANKGHKYPPEVLTPDEVQRLIAAASNCAPTGIRNRALIAVLYGGGLRLAEALALAPSDVDLDADTGGTINVKRGKGGKHRVVAIDAGDAAIVARWIETRKKLGIRTRSLFCTLAGKPLSQQYVRTLLSKRLAKRAGIEKRVHAHGLRHSRAAHLARANVPVNVIQQALGHRSLATTDRYLAHVEPRAVIGAMQQPWRVGDEGMEA